MSSGQLGCASFLILGPIWGLIPDGYRRQNGPPYLPIVTLLGGIAAHVVISVDRTVSGDAGYVVLGVLLVLLVTAIWTTVFYLRILLYCGGNLIL
jgi:hypothetical protein